MARVRLLHIRCEPKKQQYQIRVPGGVYEFTCPHCGKVEDLRKIPAPLPEFDSDPDPEVVWDHTYVI